MFHNNLQNRTSSDEQSIRLIYESYYSHVYKIAYFFIKDPYIAQDILQESFIKIFTNLNKVEESAKLKAWVTTITSRTAIDFIRKQKRRNEFDVENVNDIVVNINEMALSVEDEVEKCFLCETIRDELDTLSPDHRIVLFLKYINDMKDKEIAKFLDIKVATVKTRIHRAKNQLKKRLEKRSLMDGDLYAEKR